MRSDLPVGRTFKYKKHTLRVQEQLGCSGCFFKRETCSELKASGCIPLCSSGVRGRSVIFAKVTSPSKSRKWRKVKALQADLRFKFQCPRCCAVKHIDLDRMIEAGTPACPDDCNDNMELICAEVRL